jgi:surface carbohydrate biosynthesis protein
MRIHLMCDHKWRDLPPLAAIKLHLEGMGHRVTLSSVRDTMALLPVIQPDCVVFNHFWGSDYNIIGKRLKDAGISVVVLPTEGAGRPIFHEMDRGDSTDLSLVDRYYCWGEHTTAAMLAHGTISPDRVMTLGCARFDFYKEPLVGALPTRDEFAADYGLDPKRPIVTWATQFPHAHVVDEASRGWDQYQREIKDFGLVKCFESIGVDYMSLPRYHYELRNRSADIFFRFARENPSIQFLLKSHPNEPRAFYEDRMRQSGAQNVKFCRSEYIWDVLRASDVLIHRHCTTAVEAWMWNKPTIELAAIPDDIMAWPEREAGSVVAHDYEELSSLVHGFLAGGNIDDAMTAVRRDYIREWFGEQDGKRCLVVAQDIDRLLKSRERHRSRTSFSVAGVSLRATVSAVVRHGLSVPAGTSLKSAVRSKLLPSNGAVKPPRYEKNITRRDVEEYTARLRPFIAS